MQKIIIKKTIKIMTLTKIQRSRSINLHTNRNHKRYFTFRSKQAFSAACKKINLFEDFTKVFKRNESINEFISTTVKLKKVFLENTCQKHCWKLLVMRLWAEQCSILIHQSHLQNNQLLCQRHNEKMLDQSC